jgi:hypothetical protein
MDRHKNMLGSPHFYLTPSKRSEILSALGAGATDVAEEILGWLFGGEGLPYAEETAQVGRGILGKVSSKVGDIKEGVVKSMGPAGEGLEQIIAASLGSEDPGNVYNRAATEIQRALPSVPLPEPRIETPDIAKEDIYSGVIPLTPTDIRSLGILGKYLMKMPETVTRVGSMGTRHGPGAYLAKKSAPGQPRQRLAGKGVGVVRVPHDAPLEPMLSRKIADELEAIIYERDPHHQIAGSEFFGRLEKAKTVDEIRTLTRKQFGPDSWRVADELLNDALADVGIDAIKAAEGSIVLPRSEKAVLGGSKGVVQRLDTRKLFPSEATAANYMGKGGEEIAEVGLGDTLDLVHGTDDVVMAKYPEKGVKVGRSEDEYVGAWGIHAGTRQSAVDRLIDRGFTPGERSALIPMRMRFKRTLGTRQNPLTDGRANAIMDSPEAVNSLLDRGFDGIVYRNRAEDIDSISVAIIGNKERLTPQRTMKIAGPRTRSPRRSSVGAPSIEKQLEKLKKLNPNLDAKKTSDGLYTLGGQPGKYYATMGPQGDIFFEPALGTEAKHIHQISVPAPTATQVNQSFLWEEAMDKMDTVLFQHNTPAATDKALNEILGPLGVPVKEQMEVFKVYDNWAGDPASVESFLEIMEHYGLPKELGKTITGGKVEPLSPKDAASLLLP